MAGESGRARLTAAFRTGRPALVAYLMAGYPDPETSVAAMVAAAEAGADVIEVGVPFSDPVADGPVIARAGHEALAREGGSGLREAIAVAALVSEHGAGVPLVLMTYLNTVLTLGMEQAASRAAAAGVAGFIVPDLPAGEPMARRWSAIAEAEGLATVFLAAPTSTDERLREIADASTGFVYCVSSTGVTGERDGLASDLGSLATRVRAASRDLPVAIGFGVSSPEQAAAVAGMADGVVVGSAVVRRQARPDELRSFVSLLAEAVHATPSAG